MFCFKKRNKHKPRNDPQLPRGIEMKYIRGRGSSITIQFTHTADFNFTESQEAKLRDSVAAAVETSAVARRAAENDFIYDYDKLELWFGSSSQQTVEIVKKGVIEIDNAMTNAALQVTFYNVTDHNANSGYCGKGVINSNRELAQSIDERTAHLREINNDGHASDLTLNRYFETFPTIDRDGGYQPFMGFMHPEMQRRRGTYVPPPPPPPAPVPKVPPYDFHQWQATLMPNLREKCVTGRCRLCQSYKMGLNVNVDFNILLPYTHLEKYIQVIFAEMSIHLVRHVEDTDEVVPMRVCINTADVCKHLALTARDDAINNASSWGFYITDFATKSVEDENIRGD